MFEEHTGEVRIRLEAKTVRALFEEAGRALAELMGVAEPVEPGPWRRVTLEARDREALLVAWLNELIARTEIDHLRYGEIVVDDASERHLDARIRGAPFAETRTAVKAATMHRVRLETGPDGASATLVLDV